MKTLLLLRHAKSSWDDASLADFERPLNDRGRQDAPRMGKLIKKEKIVPEHIISSMAVRAKTTAEIISKACGFEKEVSFNKNIYGNDADGYLEELAKISDTFDRVMLVAHNPSLEELIRDLSGEFHRFPTAALAQIELPIKHWKDLSKPAKGRLVALWRPKELKK